MSDFESLANAVFEANFAGVEILTHKLIDAGEDVMEIINKGLLAGMDAVTPKFKSGEMFVPEVIMSARALNEGMKIVKPLIPADMSKNTMTVVIGTVQGDLHDIGKNLVAMLLESGGFDVIDLGVDVAPIKFVEAIKEYKPQIVGMSALLTTTMLNMKETIDAIAKEGLREKVKVIIGGAPVSKEFAQDIGADFFCEDAVIAKETVSKLKAAI